jgi:hypothetical protein
MAYTPRGGHRRVTEKVDVFSFGVSQEPGSSHVREIIHSCQLCCARCWPRVLSCTNLYFTEGTLPCQHHAPSHLHVTCAPQVVLWEIWTLGRAPYSDLTQQDLLIGMLEVGRREAGSQSVSRR